MTQHHGAMQVAFLWLPLTACTIPGDNPPPDLSQTEQHATFYTCGAGADYCRTPITGLPDEIVCGADGTSYQCQSSGWHWRPDLGACTQSCESQDTDYVCPDIAWSNACGEPQSGRPQELACNPYNDTYRCVRGAGDDVGAGHWELMVRGDCKESLGITCAPPPAAFYTCSDGADVCHAPITGVPNQIVCGADSARYQCQPDGWHWRPELGPCTGTCRSDQGLFTCGESPGLCWEPQTGVQQELNCTPYNDVMQCVQGSGDVDSQGHWEVKSLGACDLVTGRRCSSQTAGTAPCGKLGGQVLRTVGQPTTPGFASLLAICPRVAKWVEPDLAEMQAFKLACPRSKTVLRMFGYPPSQYGLPPYTAQQLWDARYQMLDGLTPEQHASIDYLESDNEADAGHSWVDPADYNQFLLDFARLAGSKGFHPLIGNIAIGNPDLGAFKAIVPAILEAARYGGGWSYHGYTQTWSKDMTDQIWFAFRYRQYVANSPELANVPLILSESGFDKNGNQFTGGYIANGDANTYIDWLTWYQNQIAQDPYVMGSVLFAYALGNTEANWPSFQLDPLEPDIERIITTCPASP